MTERGRFRSKKFSLNSKSEGMGLDFLLSMELCFSFLIQLNVPSLKSKQNKFPKFGKL